MPKYMKPTKKKLSPHDPLKLSPHDPLKKYFLKQRIRNSPPKESYTPEKSSPNLSKQLPFHPYDQLKLSPKYYTRKRGGKKSRRKTSKKYHRKSRRGHH